LPVPELLNFSGIAASNGQIQQLGGVAMTRFTQARAKWRCVMVIGTLVMLLSAPGAAWAGSRGHDSDRHRTSNQYRFQSGHAHQHHASYKHNDHGKRRGHRKHLVDYYCRACNHYFGARDELYHHVVYRHRVPYRNLEIAVSFGEFGWIFFGS
jgi:hypothetical protein